MKLRIALIALALSTAASAETPATVDAALAQAKKAHQPVLIDFSAPWCYSCYFMATHVLNGAEWEKLESRAVVVAIDADSPDGAAWMKKLEVKALPAYVVLNENGDELGRILAEQPREVFYPGVDKIIAGSTTLDQLKAKAVKGSNDDIAAVLASFEARKDGAGGLAWYASLPKASRDAAGKNAAVSLWIDRLTLDRAVKAEDNAAAIVAAERVLAGDLGCERPYVVDDLLEASDKLPDAQKKAIAATQKPALDKLLAEHVFVAHPTCADQRSAVMTTADVDEAMGDAKAATAVIGRGIAAARKAAGEDLKADRNAADNYRVYLSRAKRTAELDALYPKLIAAYPDDYVYPSRWARTFLDRNEPAKALPLLEQAAEKAYGENRLAVATLRVKALKALHRDADAEKVVAEVLEQNGKWFPEQVDQLKAALKS